MAADLYDYIAEAITAHWGERCPDYEPTCTCCAAWAQYDALKTALRPFALEADEWADTVPDAYSPLQPEPGSTTCNLGSDAKFNVGDLRRARRVYSEFPNDPA